MKIAIVEDNQIWMDRIWASVNNFFQDSTIEVTIDKYYDAGSFLDAKNEYEIIYMDVELKGVDGIEVLQHYKKAFPDAIVAIVTVHEEWWRRGYEAEAYRYICKSNLKREVQEMLQSVMPYLQMHQKMRFYVVGADDLEIAYKDVIYIETNKRNVKIHTTKGNYINNRTISAWEEELKTKGFYRVQKAYLVNLKWVDQIEIKTVMLYNGERIPLSKTKKGDIWLLLNEWRFQRKNG